MADRDAVSHALARIQVEYRLPVIHGVFVFLNQAQARVRCLGRKHNRGSEAAQTALGEYFRRDIAFGGEHSG